MPDLPKPTDTSIATAPSQEAEPRLHDRHRRAGAPATATR